MAVPHRLEVELQGPFGSQRTGQTFFSGAYHALALTSQKFEEHLPPASPEDSEFLGARLLSRVAYGHGSAWDDAEQELAALLDVAVTRPVPSLVIASNVVTPRLVLGVPHRLEWQGVSLDAALRVAEPLARGAADAARDWMRLSALQGSALEHRIFEEEFLVASLSADKALGLARQQGLEVLRIDAANVDAVMPTLVHPQAVRSAVESWARSGFAVEIPRLAVSLNAWAGSAWRVEDEASGAAGYFLAGGLAGGVTTEEPENWVLDFAADALEHLRAEPNADPLAGVEVRKASASDGQAGVVGELFPFELTVQVLDTVGRPVKGAAVEFRSLAGGGLLSVEGGSEAAAVVTTTDAGGFASAALRAGTRVLDNVEPIAAHPDDEKLTWALQHVVAVAVPSSFGELSDAPFDALALPGPPVSLRRTDTAETVFDDGRVSVWSDAMTLRVEDSFGNGVSNAEIEVSALEPVFGLAQELCGDDGVGAENLLFFDALLDAEGRLTTCPTSFPRRGDCGDPSLRLTTEADGEVEVGTILGDSHLVIYRSRAELRQVDLSLAISGSADPLRLPPPAADPGDPPPAPVPLTYVITVGNQGSHDAENVAVELQLDLPAGVELEVLEPSTGSWTAPVWTLGSLAAAGEATLTIELQVGADTVPGPNVIELAAFATAPGDPVVARSDDSAAEATSVEVAPGASSLLDPQPEAAASATQPSGEVKASEVIPPLEFEYSVQLSAVGGSCEPASQRFHELQGLPTGAATRTAEPYPLPVELLFFTADPDDCRSVPSHSCTGACVDACLGGAGGSVAVDCAYCTEGGAGCDFLAWVRECEERSWTYRLAEIVLAESTFSVSEGGVASAPVLAEDGLSARTSLTAGPLPALHEVGFEGRAVAQVLKPNQATGELEILPDTFPPWSDALVEQEIQLDAIGRFHGLDLEITDVAPAQAELADEGGIRSDVTFSYRIEPADHPAKLAVVKIGTEEGHVVDLLGTSASGEGQAVLSRGFRLDPGQLHEARLLVNPETAIEVASEAVPLPLAQQIIRRLDDPFVVSQDTDLAIQHFCPEGTPLGFALNRPAEVTLWFQRVVGLGGGGVELSTERISILEDSPFAEGEQSVVLSLADLPAG